MSKKIPILPIIIGPPIITEPPSDSLSLRARVRAIRSIKLIPGALDENDQLFTELAIPERIK